jgi:hypothetical protein
MNALAEEYLPEQPQEVATTDIRVSCLQFAYAQALCHLLDTPAEDLDKAMSIPTIDTSKPASTSELGEFFFQLGIFFRQLEGDEDLSELWYHDFPFDLDEDELVWQNDDTEDDEALGSTDRKQPPNTESICLEVGKVLWDKPMVDMCNGFLQAERDEKDEFGEMCGQRPDVPIAAPRSDQDQTGPLTLERLERLLKGLCTGDDLPRVVLTPDLSVDDGRHRVVANFLKYGKCKEISVWRRRPVKTTIDTSKKRSVLNMGEVSRMLRIAKDKPIMDAPAITGVLTKKRLHERYPQANSSYTSSRQIKEGLSAGVDNVSQERQMRNRYRELDDLLHEDYITAAQCKQARKASIHKLGSTSDALAPEDILGGGKRNAQLFGFKQLRTDDELANTDEIEHTWNEEYCNRRIQAGRTVFEGNVLSSNERGVIVCGLSREVNGVNIMVRHSDAHRAEIGDVVVVQLLPYDGWTRAPLSAIIPNDRVMPDCSPFIVPDLPAARAATQKLASVQRLVELQDEMESVKATLRKGNTASKEEKDVWKNETMQMKKELNEQLGSAQAEEEAMAAFQPAGRVVRFSQKAARDGNAASQSLTQTKRKLQNLVKYLRYECHRDPSVEKRPPSTPERGNLPWYPEEFKLEDVARMFAMDGVEMTATSLWREIGSTKYIRGVGIASGEEPVWIQVKKSEKRFESSKKASGGASGGGSSRNMDGKSS